MDLKPPRGTRDFFPEDLRLRAWLFDHFRAVARSFAFEEYDAPVLESADLYIRKAGEDVTAQLYEFRDKGGRHVALRPEMTPSLARMILQKGGSLTLPARWFSIPQCWRYERTTRGRKREHYQWNMDVFGVPGVEAEAELLAAVVAFFRRVGLGPEDIGIKVSSRKVLHGVITGLGVPDDRFAAVCVLIDKLEKLPRDAIAMDMAALGLDDAMVDAILDALSLRELDGLAGVLGEEHPALLDLRRLFALADAYGIGPWLVFDASVVRGLAYYTGVVFEAFDRGATLRAVCGGGRYDRLLSTFGGKDQPACGFGFGDVVILELLKDKGLLPDLAPQIDALVFPMSEGVRPYAAGVASRLRASGQAVELLMEPKKMKWAFKHAARRGARQLVIVGPDDQAAGTARIKDLDSGDQRDVPLDAL